MWGSIHFEGMLALSLTLKLHTSPCLIPTLECCEELEPSHAFAYFLQKFDNFLLLLVSFIFFRNQLHRLLQFHH